MPQKIGIIVVARVTSTRLPNKAICKILDQESIRVLLKRLKRIKNSNEIILATSIDKSDDILEEIAFKEKVNFYRGSLNNVALRFYEAAKKYKLDQIARVTGDAILCDEIMLEKAIDNQLVKGCDVTFRGCWGGYWEYEECCTKMWGCCGLRGCRKCLESFRTILRIRGLGPRQRGAGRSRRPSVLQGDW